MSKVPPSHQSERRKAYRLKKLAEPGEREKRNRSKREHYRKNRDALCAKLRERYKADPEYRERMKRYSREFYDHADKVQRGKELRKSAYAKDPERAKRAAAKWYTDNHARALARGAAYRDKHRERNRALARWHSRVISDRYVREQLSKHSNKSMREWTQDEVESRRILILWRRSRRVSKESATAIRQRYATDGTATARSLAVEFNIGPSMAHLILRNKVLVDDNYKLTRRISGMEKVVKAFQLFAAAGQIANAANKLNADTNNKAAA